VSDTCGCCEGPATPPARDNRPGLSAIAYRIGTYDSFLRRMLESLATALPDLTTRDPADPSIALLDGWAVVADVLTFYQERIANEGWLRTAIERRSILELARAIGYELKPGVAASAYLTFDLDTGPTAAPTATIGGRTRIQSLPASGALPQTFETSDAPFVGHPEWNELHPQLKQPQTLVQSSGGSPVLQFQFEDGATAPAQGIFVDGTAPGLAVGDFLLFDVPLAGQSTPSTPPLLLTVQALTVDTALKRTRVDLAAGPQAPPPPAPPPAPKFLGISSAEIFADSSVRSFVIGESWREQDLAAYTYFQRWPELEMVKFVNAVTGGGTPTPGVYAFSEHVAFFGAGAPKQPLLPNPANTRLGNGTDPYKKDWDDSKTGANIWTNSQGTPTPMAGRVFLERTVRGLTDTSWAVFQDTDYDGNGNPKHTLFKVAAVSEQSAADFALSGRVTALDVTTWNPAVGKWNGAVDTTETFHFRTTTAFVKSTPLTLAPLPIDDAIGASTSSPAILTLDTMVLGLEVGQPLAFTGERDDLQGVTVSEIALIKDVVHAGGRTTVYFTEDLTYRYVRKTVKISANVVAATHGQTVADEVLGGGDGSVPNQTFTLKKPPLTYVPATTPTGAESTLTLRVNGIEWKEVPSLYGLDPSATAYAVRLDDDSTVRVTGGDGIMGARLPTGSENVHAKYRSGIGLAGQVAADSLTLMQTKPPGVRTVTNPLPASGAADPESRDSARSNAPLTVVTLDRIVSLDDYGDFARGFAGIGKAQATRLTDGQTDVMLITVASASGDPLPGTSKTISALDSAIRLSRDPGGPSVVIQSFDQVYFDVTVTVIVNALYDQDIIIAAVGDAVRKAFAFDRRDFGQSVSAAEVIATMQGVAGVDEVTLTALWRPTIDQPPTATTVPSTMLVALPAQRTATGYSNAQLLLVNPVGITITPANAPAVV
jgi:hypothetical protein